MNQPDQLHRYPDSPNRQPKKVRKVPGVAKAISAGQMVF